MTGKFCHSVNAVAGRFLRPALRGNPSWPKVNCAVTAKRRNPRRPNSRLRVRRRSCRERQETSFPKRSASQVFPPRPHHRVAAVRFVATAIKRRALPAAERAYCGLEGAPTMGACGRRAIDQYGPLRRPGPEWLTTSPLSKRSGRQEAAKTVNMQSAATPLLAKLMARRCASFSSEHGRRTSNTLPQRTTERGQRKNRSDRGPA